MASVGSLQNLLADRSKDPGKVEVGAPATVVFWTDREPATVIEVSRTGHQITVQIDAAKRTDSNGMSDQQTYEYTRDPHGVPLIATRRKDGVYRLKGDRTRVLIGVRMKYHDFSF